ncbi:MAG: AAA family ATPase [Streptomycetaceae bacterium]|nr:AAA family ATPase [Streptomycetaceae bacterium]
MLISFEGIPGVGKTTQTALLAESLRSDGLRVAYLPDLLTLPNGKLGTRLFELFASSGDPFMRHGDVVTETLLAGALRAEILATHIEPALAAGQIVIEDRGADTMYSYSLATLRAHHTLTTDAGIAWLRSCGALAGREADLTILLSLPPDRAHKRTAERVGIPWNAEQKVFLGHVARAYDELAARSPRIVAVDAADLTVEQTHAAVREIVSRAVREPYGFDSTSSGDKARISAGSVLADLYAGRQPHDRTD